ncbi:MAG TPA: DivIVA domain-containing protein [Actinoplanes sp.]|jgi:DivIVA domain-containing protein
MPLTPADIHNMAFKKPPIGKRGYDEEDVDAFLDEVEQELIRLLEENQALHDQMQRGGGVGGPSPSATNMAANAELADIAALLQRAQEARGRAEQQARSLQMQLEQARNAAPPAAAPTSPGNERVLAMAQRTADDHMRDARQESESVLAEARSKSEQVVGEAQVLAGRIEGDARRNHTESMNSLESRRNALLDEIERLGQLAKGYQAALDSHLTQQLQELDSVSAQVPTGRELT